MNKCKITIRLGEGITNMIDSPLDRESLSKTIKESFGGIKYIETVGTCDTVIIPVATSNIKIIRIEDL